MFEKTDWMTKGVDKVDWMTTCSKKLVELRNDF